MFSFFLKKENKEGERKVEEMEKKGSSGKRTLLLILMAVIVSFS